MSRLLAFLGGHATWVLFVGVFLGLSLPPWAGHARPLLAPAVAVLLTATLVRIDTRVTLDYLRRPGPAAAIIAWLLVGSPLATAGVLVLLPLPGPLTTALVLMAAAPPILSAAPIAMILGLDGALALVVGLIATLLTPPTVPPLAFVLPGLELAPGAMELMARPGVVAVVAVAAAGVIRRPVGPARPPARPLDHRPGAGGGSAADPQRRADRHDPRPRRRAGPGGRPHRHPADAAHCAAARLRPARPRARPRRHGVHGSAGGGGRGRGRRRGGDPPRDWPRTPASRHPPPRWRGGDRHAGLRSGDHGRRHGHPDDAAGGRGVLAAGRLHRQSGSTNRRGACFRLARPAPGTHRRADLRRLDRKSTRLNSSH